MSDFHRLVVARHVAEMSALDIADGIRVNTILKDMPIAFVTRLSSGVSGVEVTFRANGGAFSSSAEEFCFSLGGDGAADFWRKASRAAFDADRAVCENRSGGADVAARVSALRRMSAMVEDNALLSVFESCLHSLMFDHGPGRVRRQRQSLGSNQWSIPLAAPLVVAPRAMPYVEVTSRSDGSLAFDTGRGDGDRVHVHSLKQVFDLSGADGVRRALSAAVDGVCVVVSRVQPAEYEPGSPVESSAREGIKIQH